MKLASVRIFPEGHPRRRKPKLPAQSEKANLPGANQQCQGPCA